MISFLKNSKNQEVCMVREDIEKLPGLVNSGSMNWEQVTKELVVFIIRNKPMFGLQKHDEDFMSDFIIQFLVRGPIALADYRTSKGEFLSYLFCVIKNIISGLYRKAAIHSRIEYHIVNESIINYENKVEAFQNINYEELERPKVPYSFKPVSYKDFQIACKTDSFHIKRIISSEQSIFEKKIRAKLQGYSPIMIQNILLVEALKACYYITDYQVQAISNILNIKKSILYQMIQQLKTLMDSRNTNKEIIEMRRNRAYFNHKMLGIQIAWNEKNSTDSEYENQKLYRKYEKNTKSWRTLTHQLEEGKVLIRPTTKLIAKVLGISSRQVTYYQTTARKLGINI